MSPVRIAKAPVQELALASARLRCSDMNEIRSTVTENMDRAAQLLALLPSDMTKDDWSLLTIACASNTGLSLRDQFQLASHLARL